MTNQPGWPTIPNPTGAFGLPAGTPPSPLLVAELIDGFDQVTSFVNVSQDILTETNAYLAWTANDNPLPSWAALAPVSGKNTPGVSAPGLYFMSVEIAWEFENTTGYKRVLMDGYSTIEGEVRAIGLTNYQVFGGSSIFTATDPFYDPQTTRFELWFAVIGEGTICPLFHLNQTTGTTLTVANSQFFITRVLAFKEDE